MFKNDALSQLRQLKSDIKASRNLHQGVVKGTSNKFGFVTLDSGKDIFLPADEMAKVLPGDRIEVEVKKEPKNKTFALIERLIESPTKEFFGKYLTKGNAHFVEADIPGLSQWIFIPPPKRKNAKPKDLVRCKMTQHPLKNGKAQASVLEVIGSEQDTGIEWKYAMLKHGIVTEWSNAVNDQLDAIDAHTIEKLAEGREDLTSVPFVTIDSANTQDMDDALWAEKTDDGWLLRVAIADPVALIEENSAIDCEVLKRGTTVYLSGEAVPMLPAKLSSDLASLCEGKRRLARVLDIDVKQDGRLGACRINNAVVCSSKKLNYTEVETLLQDDDTAAELRTTLGHLSDVSSALGLWRIENAIVQPGKPEFTFDLSEKKKIVSILPRPQTAAHRLVEECMVAANRSMVAFMVENHLSGIFVGHDGVREERREALSKVIKLHAPQCALSNIGELDDYGRCVRTLLGDESTASLFTLWSRQLCRSELGAEPRAHFALGLSAYTTGTSPLRKAVDYLLHRQIQKHLAGESTRPIGSDQVALIEDRTQASRAAGYDVEQWLKCQYMNKQSADFEGQVTRVFAAGCQVRLLENGIEGFVAARDIPGKFSYNQDLMTLKGEKHEFQLDQVIKVRKKQIDWSRKQVQFALAQVPSN